MRRLTDYKVHDEINTLHSLCQIYDKLMQNITKANAVFLIKQGFTQALFDIITRAFQKRSKVTETLEQMLFASAFQLIIQIAKYGSKQCAHLIDYVQI
jgi:hypothetical protein